MTMNTPTEIAVLAGIGLLASATRHPTLAVCTFGAAVALGLRWMLGF